MIQRSRSNFIGLCGRVRRGDGERYADRYPARDVLQAGYFDTGPANATRRDSPTTGTVVKFIKGHLAHSRVLIMSSNSTSEIRSSCLAAGADGFFAKPFELEDMLASICRLTPVHRLELFAHIL